MNLKKIRHLKGWALGIMLASLLACKKDFLEKKPSSSILTPTTVQELNGLLENSVVMNLTAGLPQISADEYRIVAEQNFLALNSATQRNAYTWAKDIYEGETNADWEKAFAQVFYANSVLKVIADRDLLTEKGAKQTKGWAHFARAYAYFDLMRNFAPAFSAATADVDLGLPLRLSPDVDRVEKRASLRQTAAFILQDMEEAAGLLDGPVPANNRNRPSKAAAFALKARFAVYIGDYAMAEMAADSSLKYHNVLVDYNNISKTATTPFSYNMPEVIYQSTQMYIYAALAGYNNQPAIEVNPTLMQLYQPNDLRKPIYFLLNAQGRYNVKRGYVGGGSYAFTGLACDEVFLVKAECLARRGQTEQAMQWLNRLLINRFETGRFIPLVATTPAGALAMVLEERRKELVWRGLRWSDLKRLNREGYQIMLSRQLGANTYTLPPNDPRYVFPIPDNEIVMSGLVQNQR